MDEIKPGIHLKEDIVRKNYDRMKDLRTNVQEIYS